MTEREIIATKLFTASDQLEFARLTGDCNPMHMDPVAARRTPPGAQVTHGIHVVLWALEHLIPALPEGISLAGVRVRFEKWIYVGDTANLRILHETEKEVKARIENDGHGAITLSLALAAKKAFNVGTSEENWRPLSLQSKPFELQLEDVIPGTSGVVSFPATSAEIASAFPITSASIGTESTAALAATSSLVGMVCPGLHSMYSALSLTFHDTVPTENIKELHYTVRSRDDLFRKLKLDVVSTRFTAVIDAFVRVPPVVQQSVRQIASHLTPEEFAGSCSLIVGGSRGLGELTAKILAAGGGKVIITYAVGRSEADQLAEEIRSYGGKCETLAYDVLKPADGQLASLKDPITHLYYFATPSIFRPKSGLFVESRLASFMDFYIKGFFDLCVALKAMNTAGIRVFYPSSIAVESRPANMTEYAMSKAAGELLCADMNQFLPGVEIVIHRLPRLATDQTATIMPVKDMDALEAMLPIIREVQTW